MNLRQTGSSARSALRRLRNTVAGWWSRSDSKRRKSLNWIYGAVIFLAALVTVVAFAPHELESLWESAFGGSNPPMSWAKLEVEKPVALKDAQSRVVFVGRQPQWVRSTLPQIDLTIRNDGTERVSLGRVRIEVTDSDRLTSCEIPQGGEGGIPVVKSFSVGLPVLPLPSEQVVYRQLHQEVLPGRAARVKIYLHSAGGGYPNDPLAASLFALDVSLRGGQQGQVLEIGRFVLGLPEGVPRGSGYLPEATSTLQAAARFHYLLPSTWCFQRNLAVVRRFLALPGARTPAMQALSISGPPPGWRRFEDHRSAINAVRSLLRGGKFSDLLLEPTLAVYAARRTGDQALLASTRRRAAAIFRARAESSLRQGSEIAPELGEIDARLLSRIESSPANRLLLERTAAAVRQDEAAEAEARS